MNPKFNQFIDAADLLIVNSIDKCPIMSSALALGISSTLPLPNKQVDNASNYFDMVLSRDVSMIVSEWNECIIIDAKEVIEQARIFWLIRYKSAYPLTSPMYSYSGGFFDTISGVYNIVPEKLLLLLNSAYRLVILNLASEVSSILLN